MVSQQTRLVLYGIGQRAVVGESYCGREIDPLGVRVKLQGPGGWAMCFDLT